MSQLTAEVTITNPMGLHLRTGKEVVQVANQFDADIKAQNLTRQSPAVDLKSILQIMQLQARQGHVLLLQATGQDAAAALTALTVLFQTV
jgi:phosphotransferase system HPr (HPr) family protein